MGILSNRTLIEQHPFIDDVEAELKKIEDEEKKEMEEFEKQYNPFQQGKQPDKPLSKKEGDSDGKGEKV